jgi:hypothetical protein
MSTERGEPAVMYGDTVIWTLDARDSVLLDVMAASLSLTDAQVRAAIIGSLAETTEVLGAKGIQYVKLRNPLVPQKRRREVGLLLLARSGRIRIPARRSC